MTALGRFTARRPWWIVTCWLLITMTVAVLVATTGRPTKEDISLGGSDAQTGIDLLKEYFPGSEHAGGQLVLRSASTRLDDPSLTPVIDQVAARLRSVPHVTSVDLPSKPRGTLSPDGRIGYLSVGLDLGPRDVDSSIPAAVAAAAEPASAAGLQAVPTGSIARTRTNTMTSELLGLGVATIVMVTAFGGLVAVGMPLLAAVVTIVCGIGAIGLVGHLTDVPAVASTLATMIGLGVGIDYALFLVTRYRTLLDSGMPVRQAVVETVGSSGSAVLFAGGTVVVSLAGLAMADVPILTTLGWTAGLVVLVAVAVATTLLPAVLTLLGHRINALRVRRTRPTAAGAAGGLATAGGWARLADWVTRHPWRNAVLTVALLAVLAAPAATMRLGQTDAGDGPSGTPARVGYDLVAEGFGPGANGPLTVVAVFDAPAAPDQLVSALSAVPGVASVRPARMSTDRRVASVQVIPTCAPSDPALQDTIVALRALRLPGAQLHITGAPAMRSELTRRVGDRMPYVIGVVVALAAILLLIAFRAPVLAIKAAVMNLLSVGAAYGALTVVFAWGWGVGITGLDGPIPVEGYVPMMLFALLFGLSMDYEVFLLTAVREVWVRSGDNRDAVRTGLANTGRVITSAALIMVCVFASFVAQNDPVVKMFGLGMAVAIAVDATVIRGLLVPATMALLGRANWWPATSPTKPAPKPATEPMMRSAKPTEDPDQFAERPNDFETQPAATST